MSIAQNKTPLTEQQARSLAHWWGGEYREGCQAADGQEFPYGVVIRPAGCGSDAPLLVFSREEAREMENRRGFQEACSPDWVG